MHIIYIFSCLPSDLEGAVRQSGQASSLFVSSGGMRAIVCTSNTFLFVVWFGRKYICVANFNIMIENNVTKTFPLIC